MPKKTLEDIYLSRVGKSSDKWSLYLKEYSRLFAEFRNRELSLLEIGIQNGGSLEAWADYFHEGKVFVGCDINQDCANLTFPDSRIQIFIGDANSHEVSHKIHNVASSYDIIIDDGSHKSSDIIKSFALYFPILSNNGIYIVEDLHCSYWDKFEGGLFDPFSSISFFKRMADILNYEHWGVVKSRQDVLNSFFEKYQCSMDSETLSLIHSIEFINSICIVRKSDYQSNKLGMRIISGQDELIVSGHADLKNIEYKLNPIFDQKNNPWSIRDNPPDQDITYVEQLVAAERKKNTQLQEDKVDLERLVVVEREINTQILVQKEQLENLLAYSEFKINRLLASTSWKITRPLRTFSAAAKMIRHYLIEIFEALSNINFYRNIPNKFRLLKKFGWIKSKDRLIAKFKGELNNFYIDMIPVSSNFEVSDSSFFNSVKRVAYRIDKTANFTKKDNLLLYVAYSPLGYLSEMQLAQIQKYKNVGYKVVLIINTDNFETIVDSGVNESDVQITRENYAFDFGAWKDCVNIMGGLEQVNSISFTNDSVCIVGGESALMHQKINLEKMDEDVVFLTKNNEIKPHYQSYFYRINKSGLNNGALNVLGSLNYYLEKNILISEVEVSLHLRFAKNGLTFKELYKISSDVCETRNPTIHCWKELLEVGFPYLKIQLLTVGLLRIDSPEIKSYIESEILEYINSHVISRNSSIQTFAPQDQATNLFSEKAIPGIKIFNEYGAQQAFNPSKVCMRPIPLPLTDINNSEVLMPKILAVIHCYYVDEAIEILREIASLKISMRLLLTTDSASKSRLLAALMGELGLVGNVVICQNRGRDVAPFVIETKKYMNDEEIILHLHTKKSVHEEKYSNWGKFLRKNLIGSPEIVKSILKIMEEDCVGLVYSEHYDPVISLRNWGFDFPSAQRLLKKIDIQISGECLLEFPTSTMFWAKKSAVEGLLNIGLSYDDFEEESGQVDGTLAHSIERSLLFIVEKSGHISLKVNVT